MKLTIDNQDGAGTLDYTSAMDTARSPEIERKLNQPSLFRCRLLPTDMLPPPRSGARVVLRKQNGNSIFTGYLTQSPEFEFEGLGEKGPIHSYTLQAASDEILLDQKAFERRVEFVSRSAGSALKQLAENLIPGGFDLSKVEDLDVISSYSVNPQKEFSYHAKQIADLARAVYRAVDGSLILSPIGSRVLALDETDPNFSPQSLRLTSRSAPVNDITVIGLMEPQTYVRDYFVGDGASQRFYLSQRPFQQNRSAFINETYSRAVLDSGTWAVNDPTAALSVAAQALRVSGGSGQDGQTTVSFREQIELGGALEFQHGEVSFTGGTRGIIGGLYTRDISIARCLAGFQVTPSGTTSKIQALINGSATGPTVTTTAGHRYLLTTYLYAREVYRRGEMYHSSGHAAGNGRGGADVPADVRVVLELQDFNPADPSTLVNPAIVLWDDVIADAPGFCTYALLNAMSMEASIASTYGTHIAPAEVRVALPDKDYSTQLVESLSDGGQCFIANLTTLDFYPQFVPPSQAKIVASYRGAGRAVAQVVDSEKILGLQTATDDGVRSIVRTLEAPTGRTQVDCENAALALLDDAVNLAWVGSYETWSDFLPGNVSDIFPGDVLAVSIPSRSAEFDAVVRKVVVDIRDLPNDRSVYSIEFANDAAEPIAIQHRQTGTAVPLQDLPARLSTTQVGSYYPDNLPDAQITEITSTTVQIDVDVSLKSGYGIEVRSHDFNWGVGNDRTLLGRFGSRTFSLPRLARTQTYFLKMYSGASRYSKFATALHVDSPS